MGKRVYPCNALCLKEVNHSARGDKGNQFKFSYGKWRHNLQTKKFSAPGTYIVTMVSGDDAEYLVDPTCQGTFVIKSQRRHHGNDDDDDDDDD